ncbi:MAG: malate synthase G, partial [Alphaproteobacteria bacterium]|nr:malate synthase G [Alphaproteobacteria bacterium]
MGYIAHGNLSVEYALLNFINEPLLPEAGKDETSFLTGCDEAVHQLAPRNAELLNRRETLQNKLDNWLKKHHEKDFDEAAYTNFLREIGY